MLKTSEKISRPIEELLSGLLPENDSLAKIDVSELVILASAENTGDVAVQSLFGLVSVDCACSRGDRESKEAQSAADMGL
jgi:hypothetical protein